MVNRLTMNQRIGLVIAFVVTFGGVLLMSQMGGSGPMALLFTDLDAGAAASAISELEARGVPYELADGGSAIRVPADQVLDLRVALTSSGAVDSAEGWELLEQQGLTASQFSNETTYLRALQGELAETISVIDGINSAKVHLVMPENDLFAGDDVMATASVVLQTDGTNLKSSQVRAVVNLVANSVEGLTADMVSVTDDRGQILAAPGAGITGAGGGDAMEMQAIYESKLESELTQMLSAVAGPGNAVASVTAQLDFDASQVITETYGKLEEGQVAPISRESNRTERYRGDGAELDAGVLGPEDEIVEGDEAGTGQGVEYDLDEADIEYDNDKTIITSETAPGAIQSLSVAVIVDEAAVDSGLQGELESVVAAAVGFDPDRGDTLALSFQPFNEEYEGPNALADTGDEEATTEEGGLGSLLPLIRMAVIGLIALAATVLTALFGLRGRQAKVISLDPDELTSDEDLQAIGAAAVAALGAGEGGTRSAPADLIALIESQPDDVAGMLRSWMAEDDTDTTGHSAEAAAAGAGR
jgi:flagellar M-ring protein FliF